MKLNDIIFLSEMKDDQQTEVENLITGLKKKISEFESFVESKKEDEEVKEFKINLDLMKMVFENEEKDDKPSMKAFILFNVCLFAISFGITMILVSQRMKNK